MAKKVIYLETAFWDYFSERIKELFRSAKENDPAEVLDKIVQWSQVFNFICNSSIFIDSPLSNLAFKAKDDSYLRIILKRNGDGMIDLEQSKEPFPDLQSSKRFESADDYSAVYFTKEDYKDASRKHGVLNICPNNIWNQSGKFIDSGDAIQKDREWAWRNMEILRENSNGMVLIDNFVLAPDKRTGKCSIRQDLRDLLRIILPETCDEEYQISIFYHDNSDNDETMENQKSQFYQSIRVFIKGIRKKLSVRLELFPTWTTEDNRQKDFHDRTLITNNIWIGSEAGFDLLVPDYNTNTNARAIKSTKTHGLYFGFGNESALWLEKAHEQVLDDAKKSLRKYNYTTKNRLLL